MKSILIILLSFIFSNNFAQISQKSLFDSLTKMRTQSINLLSNKMKLYLSNNNKYISDSNGVFIYKKVVKSNIQIKAINLKKVSKYDDESISGVKLLKTSVMLNDNSGKNKIPSESFSNIVFFMPNDNGLVPDFNFSLEDGLTAKINEILFTLKTINNWLNDKNEFYNLFTKLKKNELALKNKPSKNETMAWLAQKMKVYLSNNFTFMKYKDGLFVYKKYDYNINSITVYTIDLTKVLSYDNYAFKGNGVYKYQFYVSYKGMKETEKQVKENPNKEANYYNSVNYSNGNGYMTASLCDIDINQEIGLQARFQEALNNLISFNQNLKNKNEKF